MKKGPFVIVHVPHANRLIPPDVSDQFVVDDATLKLELNRLTDHYTDELFSIDDSSVLMIKSPISRFVVDVERFVDDAQEPMAAHGQGVIYMRTTQFDKLRRELLPEERKALLDSWYIPHHQEFERLTKDALDSHGRAMVIDGHSFPARPLPIDQDQTDDRPDICIGTDPCHTPIGLTKLLSETFENFGYRVSINKPYSGTFVPSFAYKNDKRVVSVMIELNRSLYLVDEPRDISKNIQFDHVKRVVNEAVLASMEWFKGWQIDKD